METKKRYSWKELKNRGVIYHIRQALRGFNSYKRSSPFLAQRYTRPKRYYNKISKYLHANYSPESPKREIDRRTVIFMVDKTTTVGLSDRLRGAIFIYNSIKELHKKGIDVDFKINFTYPFELSQYLEPNAYDWKISPDQISYNSEQSEVIDLYHRPKVSDIEIRAHRKYLQSRVIKSPCRQIHVYSNIIAPFSDSFNELFKPSASLQQALNSHQQALDSEAGYISASFRFLNLLGDFNEVIDCKTLDKQEQERLISRCLDELKKIHSREPNRSILVASDSCTFLKIAQAELPYVYIIEGEITHMGNTEDGSFELHLKTFIDYLMIAGAEKIYLLRTGDMYKSEFPRTAAMINNRPFERIKF